MFSLCVIVLSSLEHCSNGAKTLKEISQNVIGDIR